MPIPHTWHELWRYLVPFQHFFYIGAGAIAIAFRRYWQKIRENRAAGWPSADGVIQSATVRTHNGSWVEVTYRYYALQEYRYGKYRRHFRQKAQAEQFADTIRGRSLQVRYREDNPDVSAIMERDLELAGVLQMR
jgi:Protein of unknown function (DUF3592)